MANKNPLASFSNLVSTLTLPLRLADSLPHVDVPNEMREKLAEIIAAMSEKLAKSKAERLGESNIINVVPSNDPRRAQIFDMAAQIIEGLSDEHVEKIADGLLPHYCLPFVKGKDSYLAFPSSGDGLRTQKTVVDGKTISGISVWKNTWRANLRDQISASRNLPNKPIYNAINSTLRSFSRYNRYSSFYVAFADGFNPEADLRPNLKVAEAPLPETFPEVKGDKKRSPVYESLASFYVPLSLSIMNDEAPDFFAELASNIHPLSGFSKVVSSALSKAQSLRYSGSPSDDEWSAAVDFFNKQLSERLQKHPFRFVLQMAFSEDGEVSGTDAKLLKNAISRLTERVYLRLSEKTDSLTRQWYDENGFGEAYDAALSINGKDASPKLINWLVANPTAIKAAFCDDPKEKFASAVARVFGLTPNADGLLWPQAEAAFKNLGFSDESLKSFLASKTLSQNIADMLSRAIKEGDVRVETAKLSVGMLGRFLDSALRLSLPRKKVVDVFNVLVRNLSHDVATPLYAGEPLGPFIKPFSLTNKKDASFALEIVKSKKSRINDFFDDILKMYIEIEKLAADFNGSPKDFISAQKSVVPEQVGRRRYYHQEDDETTMADAVNSVFVFKMSRILSQADSVRIDWCGFPPGALMDMADELPPSIRQAVREAQRDASPPFAIALASWRFLGISEAHSGNDLVARVRNALKEELGLGDSGWKNLIKSSSKVVDSFVANLRNGSRAVLANSAQHLAGIDEARADTFDKLHFPALALSLQSKLNLPSDAVSAIISMYLYGDYGTPCLSQFTASFKASTEEAIAQYLAEVDAKNERYPSFFAAVCKRFDEITKKPGEDGKLLNAAQVKNAFLDELRQINDWLTNSEFGLWQNLPKKITWGVLQRGQEDWHRLVAENGVGENKYSRQTWPVLLDVLSSGPWQAIELASGRALSDEGQAMHHCVSSYAAACRKGESRIFSVRLGSERKCTLELAPYSPAGQRISLSELDEKTEWRIVQNKGNCNAAVKDPATLAFCSQILSAYQAKSLEVAKNKAEKQAKAKPAEKKKTTLKIGAISR